MATLVQIFIDKKVKEHSKKTVSKNSLQITYKKSAKQPFIANYLLCL
jgi:hypothetical protein